MLLPKDLREFFESLNSKGVEYLVVGAHAVAFHGLPRLTRDIDVLVGTHPRNAQRIVEALEHFGFGSLGVQAEAFQRENRLLTLGVEPNRIDIFTSILGVTFDEAWESRVPGDLDGVPVHFISRQHLVAAKRASGRHKDLGDLEGLGEA